MDSDEWIVSAVSHRLQVAGDTAVGLGILLGSEATRHLLFHLAHSKVAFRSIIGKGDGGLPSEQQDRLFVFLQPFPEVVRIGLGDSAAFALGPGGDGRQFLAATRQDVAIAFAQVPVFLLGQLLVIARRHLGAGFLEQPFHVPGPSVSIGIDDELQFA